MPVLLANNVSSVLAASITVAATSMTVTNGSRFPALTPGQHFYATIIATTGIIEIVKVTARTGNVMTITRAQDGTNAQAFPSGARVEMRINAASVRETVTDQTGPLDTRLTTAEGDITSLEGRMTTAEADIVALEAFDTALATSTGSTSIGFLQAGTGATLRTVQDKLRDIVSVKDFGAVGDDVANDLTEIQAAINSGAPVISVTRGTYNLGGGTLTVPDGITISLDGGVLSNGTISCNYSFFSGMRGLSSSIILSGTVSNTNAICFDWFTCEKSTIAQYNTFINGNNATYGAIPTISSTNRTILSMLLNSASGFEVQFGAGIYPFDAAISIGGEFRIVGLDRSKTLLWAPNSSFISMTVGGATYPYIKQISIEANNNILYTKSNTVNAIHGLLLYTSFFISYADHVFYNDNTVAGGTGCPIYGSKILDCAVYAGPGKGCFAFWGSGSNIYDNVVDHFIFFNGRGTNKKGIQLALFYNSNARDYCNSNISYSAMDYVAYFDRPSALFYFNMHNNVFEVGTFAFEALIKVDAPSSNLNLDIGSNQYIGNTAKENGYSFILLAGNTYLRNIDDNVVLYGDTIRNYSSQYVRVVTTKTDSAGTKYRLVYYEPYSSDETGNSAGTLATPSTALAELVGMSSIYAADSANISFIQIVPSKLSINGSALGPRASGTTATRPTVRIYPGYPYYDTTLNKPIVYDGTNWRDGAGTIV